METRNEPFYRKSRKAWYLQVGKRQIKLAENKAEAWAKWHSLMSHGEPCEESKPTLKTICESFLNETKSSRSEKTWQWYGMYIDRLLLGIKGDTVAENVSMTDVQMLILKQVGWKQNTRHNFGRAVQRVFSWAEKNNLIEKNPVKHLEKCPTEAREDYVTPEQWAFIEPRLPEGPFKDLLILAWDTGMRPQELIRIEARHFRKDERMVVFPASEAKGKKRPRVVYLATERAFEIIARCSCVNQVGPILTNSNGRPWNKMSVNCSMRRMAKKIGIKTHLGAFRKSYCTEALKNGVDPITLAKLMGHVDAGMIMKVYSQVHQDREFMAESAMKAKGLVPDTKRVVTENLDE
jgi:integrase